MTAGAPARSPWCSTFESAASPQPVATATKPLDNAHRANRDRSRNFLVAFMGYSLSCKCLGAHEPTRSRRSDVPRRMRAHAQRERLGDAIVEWQRNLRCDAPGLHHGTL